jgi:hypothetical protein
MHNLSQADFRHNFFTLKTPQNMYPSWRKNRTESHFSKPNFDMQGPNCCKSYNVYGDPQIFNFLLVQKNIYSLSPLCTRSLTSAQAEIWFFNSSDSGCRTKGPMPNLGRLTVLIYSTQGWWGRGEEPIREKVWGATAHIKGRKYQHDWLYRQSINSIKHQ